MGAGLKRRKTLQRLYESDCLRPTRLSECSGTLQSACVAIRGADLDDLDAEAAVKAVQRGWTWGARI